ncbi:helix-turn-helix transcriptional regulator [Flindersiella endophytica]
MDRRSELGDFLQSRRARRQPEDLGLTPTGSRRRVPGLRREELAQAAALSVDYYVRLEQGRLRNPSAEVVDAVATALALDPSERTYLHNLARPQRAAPPSTRPAVPITIQTFLDNMNVPAALCSHRTDVLAWNALTSALLTDFDALPPEERNMARLLFLDTKVAARFVEWECKARHIVSHLRMVASRSPGDEKLVTLIGELTAHSPDFARLWATHPVHQKARGGYRYRHPVIGEFFLRYEAFSLPDAPDLSLVAQIADPGSPDEQALRLLASWTAQPTPVNTQPR